jgi:hypothetical protein
MDSKYTFINGLQVPENTALIDYKSMIPLVFHHWNNGLNEKQIAAELMAACNVSEWHALEAIQLFYNEDM